MVLLTVYACEPDEVGFSDIPVIAFESLEVFKDVNGKDSMITLAITYQDGDGDIGLTATDTAPPFNFGSPFFHNLPVTYLVENSNGEYEELLSPGSDKPYGNQHERVPNLTPEGKYKAIEGMLYVDLIANPENARPNKVKFEVNLIDRNLNVSNTVVTPMVELEH